jgi:hypothetical protein
MAAADKGEEQKKTSERKWCLPGSYKTGSGKSGTRNLLTDLFFKEATCENETFSDCAEAETVFIDSHQTLKGCNSEVIGTWRYLVKALLNDALYTSRTYRKVNTYVLSFDRQKCVSFAKAVEQLERTKSSMAGEGSSALSGFCIGELDDPLGDGFSAALNDRDYWVPEIIRHCVIRWATDCPPEFLREGHRLIVNGHALRYGDIPNVGVHPDAPLVITKRKGQFVVDFMDDLANQHGESDLAMLWLLDEVAPNNSTVLLYSVDSDLMWYLLRLLEKSRNHFEIYLRYWPGLAWCASKNAFPQIREKQNQKWIHINRLKELMQSYEPMRMLPLEHRIFSWFVLGAAGGNDFVDTLPKVPVHHFIAAFLNNMEYIGDLVIGRNAHDIRLNAQSYARLIECAVEQSHLRGGKLYIVGESPKRKPRSPLYPTETGMQYRALHLDYVLLMMNSIGESCFIEPNLSEWGYGRIDPEKLVSRLNLCRLHNDDEPDEWAVQPGLPPPSKRGKAHLSQGDEEGM